MTSLAESDNIPQTVALPQCVIHVCILCTVPDNFGDDDLQSIQSEGRQLLPQQPDQRRVLPSFSERLLEVYQKPFQPSSTPDHLQHRFMVSLLPPFHPSPHPLLLPPSFSPLPSLLPLSIPSLAPSPFFPLPPHILPFSYPHIPHTPLLTPSYPSHPLTYSPPHTLTSLTPSSHPHIPHTPSHTPPHAHIPHIPSHTPLLTFSHPSGVQPGGAGS